MRIVLCAYCRRLEQVDGGWTIHGIYDKMTIQGGFPAPLPSLTVALEIESGLGDRVGPLPLVASLVDEDGALHDQIDGEITAYPTTDGIPIRQWIALVFAGAVIPRPGLYRVDITVDGQVLGGERVAIAQG